MLSKRTIKLINSLEKKKFRQELGLFAVQGEKMIEELLKSDYKIRMLLSTDFYFLNNTLNTPDTEKILVTEDEMHKISTLATAGKIMAIAEIPKQQQIFELKKNNLYLALDDLQDPGNVGTIMRLASWFGIDTLIMSENTADIYNAKTVQATMGALFRLQVFYKNLTEVFTLAQQQTIPVYGTYLNGKNIYETKLTMNGIIVLGNEGNGINKNLDKYITEKLYIPPFSNNNTHSESLNVSVAAAIVCSEFRRRNYDNF